MKRTMITTMVLAMLAAAGCAAQMESSLRHVTAGQIGCMPNDITIENDEQGWGTRSWTAVCHGHRYICSGTRGAMGCSEMHAERSRAEP